MSKLITQSLISGIDFFKSCPPTWKNKAYEDLSNQLNRIWKEPGQSVKRGIDFEKRIYAILNSKENIDVINCSDFFKEILRKCEGGTFQNKNKSFIEVDGVKYCLYGKEDVTLPEKIIDIKTTSNFKREKYQNSFQHKMYLYSTKKRMFDYIIAVFKDETSTIIERIEYIEIKAFQVTLDKYKEEIISKIKEIVQFFEEWPELKEAYHNKFNLY